MTIRHTWRLLFAFIPCLLLISLPLEAQSGGGKKTIAIGYVDTGFIGFQNAAPGELSQLFRIKVRNEIESRGRYAVVLPKQAKRKGTRKLPETVERDIKAKHPELQGVDFEKLQEMMNQLKDMQQASGTLFPHDQPLFEPFQADALFNFKIRTSKEFMDTRGGVEPMTDVIRQELDLAVYSRKTIRIHVSCTQRDVNTRELMDQYSVEASKSKFTRFAGYYTVYGSADDQRTFDRIFRSAVKKSADWIEAKMAGLP